MPARIIYTTARAVRNCTVCQQPFRGLGTLCPKHLSPVARQRAFAFQAQRQQSAARLITREVANRKPRTEIPDELDLMDARN